ncbi:MAG: hypothetical protein JO328_21305 [Hyphomicrobiales bacterium]|nr:hypothetical protein [Hyphomicrobiales bacterium]MBV9429104.1 hypothetical protein [Bradyrhizobiaceae bacterium]
MAKYAITGTQQSVSGTYKTVLAVAATSGSLRRGKIYDVLIGTNGTPADNYLQWDISRITLLGSGTAVTPVALDPADAAALGTAQNNCTSEPTVTPNSSLFNVGVNQRASYRWVAAPGSELLFPATANNGLALRTLSGGYTGSATGDFMYEEQ